MANPIHVPVLVEEVLADLDPRPGQTIVDGTLGSGGHARRIAERVEPDGVVIGLDRDPAAIAAAERNLAGLPLKIACSNYCDLPEVLSEIGIEQVDGILLDLGLSSDQLADEERGFSFDADGPLDLRFNPDEGEPAARLVNRLRPENLADLIYQYGEERYSRRIARAIDRARRREPIRTARELAEIVRRAVPSTGTRDKIDPATRTFQALRIAVNEELKSLDVALQRLPDALRPGGRLAVISFHSLEDRRLKQAFSSDPRLQPLRRKPIAAGAEELKRNPRSRSAKLRTAERAM